jgi:acetyltransferase-like isoleucine patch superfamily enzyme
MARKLLKIFARAVARLVVLLLIAPVFHLLRLCFGRQRAFQSLAQTLAVLPGLTGEYLRREFLAQFAGGCGSESVISWGTILSSPEVIIGQRVYIGSYCIIGKASIGEDTLVASRVSILSGLSQHCFEDTGKPIREQMGSFSTVTIGPDCWIGEGAILGADVGEHSVVGAGSVVLDKVPPWSIVAGNPARVVRSRR